MIVSNDEFRAICSSLAPLVQQARELSVTLAAEQLALDRRHETIFVATRSTGKTAIGRASKFGSDPTICEVGGYFDAQGGETLRALEKTLAAMLKVYREQRAIMPKYRPKIFLRSETWAQLKPRFHWVDQHQVAEIEFPRNLFYQALQHLGAPDAALAFFGPAWLEGCQDSTGRLLPGLAFDALEHAIGQPELRGTSAKWQGHAHAAAKHIQSQPDLAFWLPYLAPADKHVYSHDAKLTIPLERTLERIRSGRQARQIPELPYGMTGPQFVKHLEHAGVWHQNNKKFLEWARPYAVGATFLKSNLTADALRRMLQE
jgi:hypothetical protein